MNPASAPACSRDGCSLKVADGLTTSSFIAFAIYVCIIQTEITFVKGFDKKIWSYGLSDSHKIRQVMKMKESKIQCFTDAVSCLPPRLQNAALNIPDWQKEACEELHLRAGHTISAVLDGCEQQIPGVRISIEDLRETVSRAARYSVHSYGETLAQGYLPLSRRASSRDMRNSGCRQADDYRDSHHIFLKPAHCLPSHWGAQRRCSGRYSHRAR